MKLAIMQPYIFPYIGYFSLIHSVDKFVFFDDVNFIKRGWINRNKILSSKKELLFSIPLKKASQNKLINEIFIADEVPWEDKLLRTIEHSYGREPGFIKAYPLIEEVKFGKEYRLNQGSSLIDAGPEEPASFAVETSDHDRDRSTEEAQVQACDHDAEAQRADHMIAQHRGAEHHRISECEEAAGHRRVVNSGGHIISSVFRV